MNHPASSPLSVLCLSFSCCVLLSFSFYHVLTIIGSYSPSQKNRGQRSLSSTPDCVVKNADADLSSRYCESLKWTQTLNQTYFSNQFKLRFFHRYIPFQSSFIIIQLIDVSFTCMENPHKEEQCVIQNTMNPFIKGNI